MFTAILNFESGSCSKVFSYEGKVIRGVFRKTLLLT